MVVLMGGIAAAATPDLPQPAQYAEDQAAVLIADHKHKLNGLLQELEQKTGAQFIVLTVQSTRPLPIERFSIELAEKWKLGRKDRDDGFLFTVAVQDREFRFEVGYGLEGFLTDQFCGQVGRGILVPHMKQGRYSEGIYQATLAIADRIAKQHNITLTGMPAGYANPVPQRPSGSPLCGLLPVLILFFVFMTAAGRGSMFWPLWFLLGSGFGASRNPYDPAKRGYWGHWNTVGRGGFGGGFGSGGFGGFGGGGGGGFGGGGFSGKW
jgi:uncharacterized protein